MTVMGGKAEEMIPVPLPCHVVTRPRARLCSSNSGELEGATVELDMHILAKMINLTNSRMCLRPYSVHLYILRPNTKPKERGHCHKLRSILLWNTDFSTTAEEKPSLASLCVDNVDRRTAD